MLFVNVEPERVEKGNEGTGSCDSVIYNKKYIFDLRLHFWHTAPKNFGISCDESHKVSFVMLMR